MKKTRNFYRTGTLFKTALVLFVTSAGILAYKLAAPEIPGLQAGTVFLGFTVFGMACLILDRLRKPILRIFPQALAGYDLEKRNWILVPSQDIVDIETDASCGLRIQTKNREIIRLSLSGVSGKGKQTMTRLLNERISSAAWPGPEINKNPCLTPDACEHEV